MPATAYAAVFEASREEVQVIEGHTVYVSLTVNTSRNLNPPPPLNKNRSEQGTAVAVLTREIHCGYVGGGRGEDTSPAFDGVLWFNDQFLVGEEADTYNDWRSTWPRSCQYRYPCGGRVYATPAGAGDPFDASGNWVGFFGATYQHSYKLTDPNDHVWMVDFWQTGGPRSSRVWISAPLGGLPPYVDDDGRSNCMPYIDNPPAGYDAVGSNGRGYSNVEYNGLLFMLWKHLSGSGTVQFGENGTHNGRDTDGDNSTTPQSTGSHPNVYNRSYTPGNGTGNSHPFNPYEADAHDKHTHSTARVDIYFHPKAPPGVASRKLYIDDSVGSNACFHEYGEFSGNPKPVGCENGYPAGPSY
ncbi:MAG TPA: hypothetical protein VNZ52_05590 [Candidatus Thermoplasmatota archaeon]|nr:hypothetical protein [Candidatus Thermoplasmatota archaeon]